MEKIIETTQDERKIYVKPEILHELDLETRAAGSLPSIPSFMDENQ